MRSFLRDLRHAFRGFLRAPTFTTICVLTLALGIGANTAIFSLVHTVLLKPLPFRDPNRLITAWDSYHPQTKSLPMFPKIGISPVEFDSLSHMTDIFEDAAWYRYVPYDASLNAVGSEAQTVRVGFISTNLLPLLGVRPSLGRSFAVRESPDSALLSDHLWRTGFAADPQIAGKTIRLNDQVFTIAGVMPGNFKFPDWADLWLPPGPQQGDEMTNPVRHATGFIARLRPGVSIEQASAHLETLSRQLASAHSRTSAGWELHSAGLQADLTASVRPALLMLFGAVGLVLLMSCVNVANLLLARATGRTKEIAVRSALGAGSWRIARQLLAEGAALSAMGGALGLAVGAAALKAISPIETSIDLSAAWFLLGISAATGIVFGLVPLAQTLRADTMSVIKSGAAPGVGHTRLRSTLVIAEFAFAVVLIAGAGLLLKSFLRLMHVDPGFNPQGLLTMRLSFSPTRATDSLFHQIEDRVRRIPGVDEFATTSALPLTTNHGNASRFNVPGNPLIDPDSLPAAQIRFISPDYFQTMRIPVRNGRTFTAQDLNQPVVIVNQAMASRFWPGKNPIGQKFITGPWGPNPTWSTIIGVVGDVKQFGLDSDTSLDMYFPALFPASIIVHTTGNPGSLIPAVRREIQSVDPSLPISEIRTMDQVLSVSAESRRWTMTVLAAFAGIALILALVGIYGVISWSVAQRTREIGIRSALGAGSGELIWNFILHGMKLSAVGLAIGLSGAYALRQVLATQVFDVSTSDPLIYAAVILLMMTVALLASYIPARRASRVDPITALRWE